MLFACLSGFIKEVARAQMATGKVLTEFLRFGHVMIPPTITFYQTSLSYACVNKRPVLAGHVMVMPLRPVERFAGLTADEVRDLFMTVQRISVVIEKMYSSTSLTISLQDGPDAGQSVKHVHVHILPRKAGDFLNNDDIYKELQGHDKDETRKDRSLQEMEEEAALIRNTIESNNEK